jgi:hypothetical protein
MTIDELIDMWEEDSNIDRNDLSGEALRIPKLHGKYYRLFSHANLKLAHLKEDRKRLYLDKLEYIQGIMPAEELKKRGWEQFGLKILKAEQSTYIDADKDIIALNLKIAFWQEKVNVLDSFIKSLSFRNMSIKNYIDFEKFRAGS